VYNVEDSASPCDFSVFERASGETYLIVIGSLLIPRLYIGVRPIYFAKPIAVEEYAEAVNDRSGIEKLRT